MVGMVGTYSSGTFYFVAFPSSTGSFYLNGLRWLLQFPPLDLLDKRKDMLPYGHNLELAGITSPHTIGQTLVI